MSIWTRLLRRGQNTVTLEAGTNALPPIVPVQRVTSHPSVPASPAMANPSQLPLARYAQELKKAFGLIYQDETWSYDPEEVYVRDAYRQMFSDPGVCFLLLKKLRAASRFDRVCVVKGPLSIIVIESLTDRPIVMISELGDKASALATVIIEAGGRLLYEYDGLFLMALPSFHG
jgi:hypothetical protein